MKLRFLLLCLLFAGAARSQELLQQGREALTDRRYDEAARLLGQAAAPGQERADEAQLLLGHALLHGKKFEAALAAYDKLLADFPNSVWRKKALFKKADVFIAQKQWDKAAAIYEPELDYIVSDDRKEKVAEIYLKYAGQYFTPVKNAKGETPAPNFSKAKSLFQKSLDIGLTAKKTEEVLLNIALCDVRSSNWGGAIAPLRDLLAKYPQGATVEEAKYQLGIANLRAGNDREARKLLRDFLRDLPTAKRRGDATYALAESYHVPNPRDAKELQLGVQVLRDFARDYPGHERALQAGYFVGLSLFNQSRYEDAVKEFQSFIGANARATNDSVAQAKNQLGLALLRQKKYDAAIGAWESFLREHPVHALWQNVQRQVIDAQYAIGDEAYNKKQYEAARLSWQAFTDKYPLDMRNADIMFRLGVILSEAKQYDAAIEQWRKVAIKYGGSEAASRGLFMIAMTHETLGRFEEAMTAHRAVVGRWVSDAQNRLAELRNRKMLVYTERTFTTADKPALKLVTRNVKSVALRAYKVDMNDYFRKLHTMRGVDKLDLALIEPNWRWTLDIPEFQDFKQSEAQAPLPFKEPGVYAVVCSSAVDAKDEKQAAPTLEATNIVLITDLGMVAKVTHNDVLVFAQNLKTRQPWPGAQIILTDGHRVVASGDTNADGIFQWRNEAALKTATVSVAPLQSDVRVLAQNAGHYASTENHLGGVARVAGLQPRGFVYTDRPLYRAGQPVFFRAIVRQTENGAYAFNKSEPYLVQVTDAGGGVIFSKTLPLSDFGTLGESLTLGADAAPGRYTIYVTRPKEKIDDAGPQILPVAGQPVRPVTVSPKRQTFTATGYFSVAAYRLEKVRISVDLPKSVYLRGEEIKGKVVAKYLHGEPLSKRKIRFGWNSEIGEERETGATGEFEFTIPTRPFEEDQTVTIWARLDEENAGVERNAFVATVGVRPQLSMLRDVHLLGEKFEVSIETKDLADKPFAGDFKLVALKLEKDEAGRLGEKEIQSVAVKTAADGKATAPLTLTEAGEYVLRLTGQDGNGNPVSADLATQIVGDEDKVRLRILCDKDAYKLGETAAVRVVWRGPEKLEGKELPADAAAPKLALVTYESDRIYGYQLITLNKSDDNQISVPLNLALAPSFRLSIALMDGNQFHETGKWLRVEHELKIKIKTAQEKYRPGDKVKVEIEVTDQNGKPVAAELSLAAVDQALLAAAGATSEAISSLLQTREARDDAMQTLTSATFHYAAQARQTVLQVREAEDLTRTMLAGRDAGADLPRGHWTYDALDRLAKAGIVQAQGGRNLTRFDAANVLAQSLRNENINQLSSNLGRQRANVQLGGGDAQNFDLLAALKNEFKSELKGLGMDISSQIRPVIVFDSDGSARASRDFMNDALPNMPASGNAIFAPKTSIAMGVRQSNLSGIGNSNGFVVSGGGAMAGNSSFGRQLGGLAATANRQQNGKDELRFGADRKERGAQAAGVPGLELSDKANFADSPMLGEALEKLVSLDAQNALLARGGDGEAQFQELFAFLPPEDRNQLKSALRRRFSETAFWNAAIVTDEKGHAEAEFTLPDSLTEWRLAAAGVTRETLVGETTQTITASKPLSVEIKAPSPLQQGDRATIAAVLHNNSDKPVTAQISLRAKFGGVEKPLSKTVTVEANATQEISLVVEIPNVRDGKITASATAAGQTDTSEQTVAVQPWGIERNAVASGKAEGTRNVELKLPSAKYDGYRLKLTVGPASAAALLDIAASPAGDFWRAPLVCSDAHRAVTVAHAINHLRARGQSGDPLIARLTSDLQSLVSRLSKSQNEDGGWGWALRQAGKDARSGSDVLTSADAASGLAMAAKLGLTVAPGTIAKAKAYLQARYSEGGESGNDRKAVILHAQSLFDGADFAPLNRLHRLRNSLDARSLAHLALALRNAERAPEAQEVVRLLEERIPKDALRLSSSPPSPNPSRREGSASTGREGVLNLRNLDDVALATQAIARIAPKSLLLADLAAYLWSHRIGNGWGSPRATAHAVAALLGNDTAANRMAEKYTLAVSVNGKEIKSLSVDGNAKTTTLTAPAELLTGPSAKVDFTFAGKGVYTYAAELIGFTSDGLVDDATREKLEREGKEWRGPLNGPLVIERSYTQAPLIFNGKPVPRGFETVATDTTWGNKAGEVNTGKRVQVALTWWIPQGTDLGERQSNYIVVREPVPAGCRVDENTITGQFERYEIGDGAITFYFYNLGDPGVNYDLYGVREGNYRVLPTKVWAFERPGLWAYGTFKNLSVLPRDAKGKDVYRLTPDELFHLGKLHFDRAQEAIANGKKPADSDLKATGDNLLALFNKDADPKGWKLHDDPARETVRMLYGLALLRDDAPGAVRFFEVLRERFPQIVIPFKDIVQTAKAYGKLGEREREVQVLRTTAEASFGREAKVAASLEDEGEHQASFRYVAERAREYPDVANVEASLYALAQTVAQRADDERKNGRKESGKELGRLAADMLRDFLATYAENPAGDEAAFAYAVNLVEQEKFDDAAAWCNRSLTRHGDSIYADDLTYIATYACYLGERFDDALKLAQELVSKDYAQPGGAKKKSDYRGFALYIAAQIFHARGDAARAVEFYRQVGEQFPDARESAAYFLAKELKIPEVLTVAPGEPARLKISARNVKDAQISVYKVDLLKFYQNRRNLLNLGAMNLAGIKPAWESTVDLGGGEFIDKIKTIDLPLPEKGAYFVALKTDDGETRLNTSGVVVRSDIQLNVQEDEAGGRVRVNVAKRTSDEKTGPPLTKAEVWVIGSVNDSFRKGQSDLRGLVTADDVRGKPTVIAYRDGDYAFYRSDKILQPQYAQPAPPPAPTGKPSEAKKSFKDQARDAYIGNNEFVQHKQADNYRGLQGKNANKDNQPADGLAAGQAF